MQGVVFPKPDAPAAAATVRERGRLDGVDMTDGTCSIDGCDRGGKLRRGWCNKHYQRWLRHGDPNKVILARGAPSGTCHAPGCENPTPSERRLYCSPRCRKRVERAREIELHGKRNKGMRAPRSHAVTCETCGTTFSAKQGVSRFCSRECHRASPGFKAVRRISRLRRKAQKRTTQTEPIDPNDIYERDGWRCGICGKRVGKSYKNPHPRSVSLDHIIPLADGGTHTRANVQCSHLECNITKSNTGSGQLMLVG